MRSNGFLTVVRSACQLQPAIPGVTA